MVRTFGNREGESHDRLPFSMAGRYIAALLLALLLLPGGASNAAPRKPLSARHGMVVSADSLASAAGVEVLRQGGNAVDAAVMVGFVLAVTYPEAGNLGGGGFMLIRMADGRSTMIDFREKAPAGARESMFLDGRGDSVPGLSQYGPIAAGVPGTVAGLLTALSRYGTMERVRLLDYPVKLASDGFRVDERLAESLQRYLPDSLTSESALRIFRPHGVPYRAGDRLRQPDLAATLRAIREKGEDGFYRGKVARLIEEEMKRGEGIITRADLAAYRAVERVPLMGSYRGYEILTASPPSGGGTTLLAMLNILEQFDVRGKGHNSSRALHLFAAAAREAYADRALFLGDPDFVSVPVDSLTGKALGARRAGMIDSLHAPASAPYDGAPEGAERVKETTHFCVADRFGNVVSTTYTVNDVYGGRTVVSGGGFFLNDEMDDFSVKPGVPNMFGLTGGSANAIAPGKRMLSSMTPTIILKNGTPFLLLGARGGSRITTSVAQVILNIVDFGLSPQEAVDASRIHYQGQPDEILVEKNGYPLDVIDNLRTIGYIVRETLDWNGRCHAIMIEKGRFVGLPDPREDGVAVGWE